MNMTFSEKFKEAVGDTTIYRLSKSTGIERTKLQRIKSGQKLPTKEELELICISLALSPTKKSDLTKEYEIALIGEDRYKSRILTANFIENLYNIFESKQSSIIKQKFVESLDIKCPSVINDKSATYSTIKTILQCEAVANNTIYMYGNIFDNILLDNVKNISGLSVQHIFQLSPHDESYSNYYSNINIINKIYPIFLSQTDYHAYYYYDNNKDNSVLPYFIVTNNYLVTISYDQKSAVISQDENIIKLHKYLFEQKINNSYALITDINTIMEYSGFYLKHYGGLSNSMCTKLVTLEYEPCLTPFFGNEIIEMCMRKNIPDYPVILERAKNLLTCVYNYKQKVSIFTEKGLDNFIATGRITEIPEFVYDPIPPKARIQILNKLCKSSTDTQEIELHLIRDDKLRLPKNLRYCGMGQVNDFLLLLSDEKNSNSFFELNECGFAKPFYDFASSLVDSDAVYSNEETVRIIQNKTKQFSQSL